MSEIYICNVIVFKNDFTIGEHSFNSESIYLHLPTDDPKDDIVVHDIENYHDGTMMKLREMETGKEVTLDVYKFIDSDGVDYDSVDVFNGPKKFDISAGDQVYFIHNGEIKRGELLSIKDGNYTVSIARYKWMVNPETAIVDAGAIASVKDVLSFKENDNGGHFSYDIEDYKTHSPVSLLQKHKG